MSVCIHTHICVGGHVRKGRPKIDNRCLPYQSLTYMLPQGLKPELTLSAPVASCIAVGIPFPPPQELGIQVGHCALPSFT